MNLPLLQQTTLTSETGAGAAGSSAAYHLRKYANESGIPINVTVFEKTGRIGGRTLTVNVYDDPIEPIELGASIFVDVNYILSNATRDSDSQRKILEPTKAGFWVSGMVNPSFTPKTLIPGTGLNSPACSGDTGLHRIGLIGSCRIPLPLS